MKLKILSITGQEKGTQALPSVFDEPVRSDLIKRAVDAIDANNRQAYGAYSEAGLRHSAEVSRRRRDYRGSYGAGISRVPRKVLSRRGTRFNWVGAVAPGTVGGRRAHPPKAEKIRSKDINVKERKQAIRSALAATLNPELVTIRGHVVPQNYPFVLESAVEDVKKTSQLMTAFEALGFSGELDRTNYHKIRAGKAKARGRKYAKKTGVLLVTASSKSPVMKAIANIPGFEAYSVHSLNAKVLAPGGNPARMTIFTQGALDELAAKKLFMINTVEVKPQNKKEKATSKPAEKKVVKTKSTAKKE